VAVTDNSKIKNSQKSDKRLMNEYQTLLNDLEEEYNFCDSLDTCIKTGKVILFGVIVGLSCSIFRIKFSLTNFH
jgi:katanin p60 ATPase-containing subunit A1